MGENAGRILQNDSITKSVTRIDKDYRVLNKMLEESQNWIYTLIFQESDCDAEESQTVDLIK